MSQPESIPPRISAWTLLGFTCLAATLLLSSPGVQVVRAEEPAAAPAPLVSEAPAAASCSADPANPPLTPAAAQQQAAAQARVALSLGENDGSFVMLNGSGYNYGPATESPDRAIEQIERELRRD